MSDGREFTRDELAGIMDRAIEKAQLEGRGLDELYELSKSDLFSPLGGEILREVIERHR